VFLAGRDGEEREGRGGGGHDGGGGIRLPAGRLLHLRIRLYYFWRLAGVQTISCLFWGTNFQALANSNIHPSLLYIISVRHTKVVYVDFLQCVACVLRTTELETKHVISLS